MSWFGEQFSSITEKITDLTKDVLLDSSSKIESWDDQANGVLRHSGFENQAEVIEAKELLIRQLKDEKEMLENSILELNDQHHEAIDVLLNLKTQFIEESKNLKEKLSAAEEKIKCLSCQNIQLGPLAISENLFELCSWDTDDPDSLLRQLTKLADFCSIEHSDANLNKRISKFEQIKNIVQDQNISNERNLTNAVEIITSYIEFLKFLSDKGSECSVALNDNIGWDMNLSAATCQQHDMAQTESQYSQTDNSIEENCVDIKSNVSYFCGKKEFFSQTENSTSFESSERTYQPSNLSRETQTEIDFECGSCHNSKHNVNQNENDFLKQKLNETEKKQVMLSPEQRIVTTQTEFSCECEILKNKVLEIEKELEYSKIASRENLLMSWLQNQCRIAKDSDDSIVNETNGLCPNEEIVLLQQKLDIIIKCLDFQNLDFNQVCNGINFSEHLPMSDNDKLLLQQKLKQLDLEKSQLLCVLNEKSQECSTLKSEVHRLTNIVSSEKQALMKLQKDNQELKLKQENNLDPELTKETLQKLSQLIRDKDVEIEALKQKNDSLTSVVQETCTGVEHTQSLMKERDELLKEIKFYKADREKVMLNYNTKDQEFRQLSSEMNETKIKLHSTTEEFELLQNQHHTVALHYEEKQNSAINFQNETIILKQQVANLKQKLVNVNDKYAEALNQMNSETVVTIPRNELNDQQIYIEELNASLKEKNDLIHEKDCIIHSLSQQAKSSKLSCDQYMKDVSSSKKEKEDLLRKLAEYDKEIKKENQQKEAVNQKLADKLSELNLLREMNERLSITLKEKEFSLQSLEEKVSSLYQVINADSSSTGSVDQILEESKEMFKKAQQFHRERDEVVLSLNQSQQENQDFKNEIQRQKISHEHLKNELDRLRKHLLQVEENYTNEALRAEEREEELRHQLIDFERAANQSNSAVLDVSQQANVQVASLQEQIVMIASQRDSALMQLSELEDKTQQYSASLNNLQLVIEQMQKGHTLKITDMEKKCQQKLDIAKQDSIEFNRLLETKQVQLEGSLQALEAASRLSEQLDAKVEVICKLKSELAEMHNSLQSTNKEINSIKTNAEGKVDRVVMKSLVLGYFSTPPGQKSEVIRLLARVLDFSQEEMAKAGIVVCRNSGNIEHKGIFSSLFSHLPSLKMQPQTPNSPSKGQEVQLVPNQQSLGALFVKFLENESQPRISIPFPVEKMAQELTSKTKLKNRSTVRTDFPFSSTQSPLLIGIDAAFPTFAPVPAVNYNSPASTILQEVLD